MRAGRGAAMQHMGCGALLRRRFSFTLLQGLVAYARADVGPPDMSAFLKARNPVLHERPMGCPACSTSTVCNAQLTQPQVRHDCSCRCAADKGPIFSAIFQEQVC